MQMKGKQFVSITIRMCTLPGYSKITYISHLSLLFMVMVMLMYL